MTKHALETLLDWAMITTPKKHEELIDLISKRNHSYNFAPMGGSELERLIHQVDSEDPINSDE